MFNLIFSWFALVSTLPPNFFYAELYQGNYFIAFTVLSNALEDPSYNLKGIHVVNIILEYFYVGLLLMCFILALGNRPQGSKWAFTAAFIGFALVTLYMTVGFEQIICPRVLMTLQFAAIFLAVRGIQGVEKDNGGIDVGHLFSNSIFRNVVISLAATTGLYLIASLIFVSI